MGEILRKLKTDPVGLVRRGVHKAVIGRITYRKGSGYDAGRYWGDRLGKYGAGSLKGVGDEGLTEEQNREMYEAAAAVFRGIVDGLGLDLTTARVLEGGVGTGFYAGVLHAMGVCSYVGVDVTDALFNAHRARFPDYTFVCADIGGAPLGGSFELAVLIDVIEHIVEDERFDAAMATIRDHVAPGGAFVVAPIAESTGRKLFHTRFWSLEDIVSRFDGWEVGAVTPFRSAGIVALRKPRL